MTTYAIGDIQGCYDELMKLLALIEFDFKNDRLLLVGDLVNRGPKSLNVLRFLFKNQSIVQSVLGNHDLHLLSIAYGYMKPKSSDTLTPILEAKDKFDLIDYLRSLPLYIQHENYHITHAGIPPIWSLEDTQTYASEVTNALQSDHCHLLLKNLYGNTPSKWHNDLEGIERLRCIINYLTRMRLCDHTGNLDFEYKKDLNHIPSLLTPWFDLTNPYINPIKQTLLFGHWAALQGQTNKPHIIGLDYGCVWGGKLAAYALETQRFYFIDAQ